MNTRELTTEYRLRHWSGVMQKRKGSGLSIRSYCARSGIHENTYYYWQKKLRELACNELSKEQCVPPKALSCVFAEVNLSESLPTGSTIQNEIIIETSGIRITASIEYPVEKLAVLLREMRQPC